MLPRWHLFWGAVVSCLLLYVAPGLQWWYYALFFCASVFIDADHYITAVHATKKWKLADAFRYYELLNACVISDRARGIRKKYDFHVFHTIEFHLCIALLGLWWTPFFYLFLGMAFHSLLDIYSLLDRDVLYMREFFLSGWLWKRFVR